METGTGRRIRFGVVVWTALASSLALLPATTVFGRAGYYRPSAGYGFHGWGGGWGGWHAFGGMPHHNLGAVKLPGGPVIDRRSFRGSSVRSQPSGMLHQESHSGPASSSTWHRTQSTPYDADSRYEPPYYHNYNGYWLHGYWGGGLWGWGRWGGTMGIWSLPRWSMGPIYFPSGYGAYKNPFLSGTAGLTQIDQTYVVPITIVPDDAAEAEARPSTQPGQGANALKMQEAHAELMRSPQAKAGLKPFDAARDAFRTGDYQTALSQIDAALVILPDDAAFHQFRALILFAQEEYRRAAIGLYAALSVSPGFDWTTLSGFYPDNATYTAQLRKLEAFHKAHPDSDEAAFLLSYHYLTCRQPAAALKQMQRAAQLLPTDILVAELVEFQKSAAEYESVPLTYGPDSEDDSALPVASGADTETGDAIDPAKLVGAWHAERSGDVQIDLTLAEEGTFTWKASERGTLHEYAGEFAVGDGRIVLAGPRGTILAELKQTTPKRFTFKLVENDPADQGVEFVRAK